MSWDERRLVSSVLSRPPIESLRNAMSRWGNNDSNNDDDRYRRRRGPTAQELAARSAALRQQQKAEEAAQARRKAVFDAYEKTPDAMLWDALYDGDIDKMASIMDKHKLSPDLKIAYVDREGKMLRGLTQKDTLSLLKIAFARANSRAICFLIDKGANYKEMFDLGLGKKYTILYMALSYNFTDVMDKILSLNPPREFIDDDETFELAIRKGNMGFLKKLIAAGAKPRSVRLALLYNQYEIADYLKQSGAERPYMRDIDYEFNLMALNWIVKNYLADLGLPSNTYTNGSSDPNDILFKIVNLKNPALLAQFFNADIGYEAWSKGRLTQLRPCLDRLNSEGNNPLMAAIVANNSHLTNILLNIIKWGGKISIQNNEGNTSLHLAALAAKGKTGDERAEWIKIINRLIDLNQWLTKIKNKAGYGAGNPKLGVNAEITKLIHGRKPWFAVKKTNKVTAGGSKVSKKTRRNY